MRTVRPINDDEQSWEVPAVKVIPAAGTNERTLTKMAKQTAILELPVAFGNVNIGDATASVKISISRNNLKPAAADKHLCGMRLSGTIYAAPSGVSTGNGQKALPGADGDEEIAGIFDVKGFTVTPKKISAGLTFSLKDLDIGTLSHFAKRDGRMVINGVQKIEDEEESDEEGDE